MLLLNFRALCSLAASWWSCIEQSGGVAFSVRSQPCISTLNGCANCRLPIRITRFSGLVAQYSLCFNSFMRSSVVTLARLGVIQGDFTSTFGYIWTVAVSSAYERCVTWALQPCFHMYTERLPTLCLVQLLSHDHVYRTEYQRLVAALSLLRPSRATTRLVALRDELASMRRHRH